MPLYRPITHRIADYILRSFRRRYHLSASRAMHILLYGSSNPNANANLLTTAESTLTAIDEIISHRYKRPDHPSHIAAFLSLRDARARLLEAIKIVVISVPTSEVRHSLSQDTFYDSRITFPPKEGDQDHRRGQ